MVERKGCSANGIPTILIIKLSDSLAIFASSAVIPEPVPPPNPDKIMTNSDVEKRFLNLDVDLILKLDEDNRNYIQK